jgi:hypothetical protein
MELFSGSTATGNIQSRAMPITWRALAGRPLIIPSHDLVVVRLGHYRGESYAASGFSKALALLIEAVPKAQKPQAQEFDNRGHNGPSEKSKNIENRVNEAIGPPVGK